MKSNTMLNLIKKIDKFVNLKILVIAVIVLAILSPFITIYRSYYRVSFADKTQLIRSRDTGIILLDRNGQQFYASANVHKKTIVPFSEISPNVINALISYEDKNFYKHPGFSLRAMARSAMLNIKKGDLYYGGSTITQQLVKNTLLHSKKDISRKLEEIFIAWQMEKRFSKQEILEMYLNTVYFGENSYGIEQAAITYFNKKSKDLTIGESALIIGLVQSPSYLSPISNDPPRAIAKQKKVINKMAEQGLITDEQAKIALAENLVFSAKKPYIIVAPHFALYVQDELKKNLGKKLDKNLVVVKTTLDLEKQIIAEDLLKIHVDSLRNQHVSNGATITIEPKSREIITMAGSADWDSSINGKINMALRPRQSGSAFKPIVYATAFSDGSLTPSSIIEDKKITFPGNYTPKNYDLKYRGKVTVRVALANSLNIPAVQAASEVGPSRIVDMARHFGINNLSQYATSNLSIALGTEEIPLIELTNVYATLASYGEHKTPKAILEIVGKDGKSIPTPPQNSSQIIDARIAFLISNILSDNQARARIFGRSLNIDRPAAVKTGTTSDYRDAWTMGYTPSLVVGVWIGNNDNSPMYKTPGATGAAPLWKKMMTTFLADTPPENFYIPQGVISERVCRSSGLLAKSDSGSSYNEFFLVGTEPTQYCATATPPPSPSPQPGNEPEKSLNLWTN